MSNTPTPKTDALRALREARAMQIREDQAAAAGEKPKVVKRSRKKET